MFPISQSYFFCTLPGKIHPGTPFPYPSPPEQTLTAPPQPPCVFFSNFSHIFSYIPFRASCCFLAGKIQKKWLSSPPSQPGRARAAQRRVKFVFLYFPIYSSHTVTHFASHVFSLGNYRLIPPRLLLKCALACGQVLVSLWICIAFCGSQSFSHSISH